MSKAHHAPGWTMNLTTKDKIFFLFLGIIFILYNPVSMSGFYISMLMGDSHTSHVSPQYVLELIDRKTLFLDICL